MNIIYAAEKPSIAVVLSDYLKRQIELGDIDVADNPDQTGSFFVHWRLKRFVLAPDGAVRRDTLSD